MEHELSGADRDFLTLFGRIIFTNPFGEDRAMMERLLADSPTIREAAGDEPVEHYFQLMVQ